jgi:hypothetical protein
VRAANASHASITRKVDLFMHMLRMGLFAIAGGTSLIFTSPGNALVCALIVVSVLLVAALANVTQRAWSNSRSQTKTTRPQRFVLGHPQLGVYLGSHGSIGLWSGLNLSGRREAHTFASVYDTREIIRRYSAGHTNLHAQDFTIKRVRTPDRCLPLRECARIGLPVCIPVQA